jgi:hypothetical protein
MKVMVIHYLGAKFVVWPRGYTKLWNLLSGHVGTLSCGSCSSYQVFDTDISV